MAFVQRFIVRYPAMSVSMQSPCIATRINIRWIHSNKRVPEKYILLSQWKTDIGSIITFVQRCSTPQCRFPCKVLALQQGCAHEQFSLLSTRTTSSHERQYEEMLWVKRREAFWPVPETATYFWVIYFLILSVNTVNIVCILGDLVKIIKGLGNEM